MPSGLTESCTRYVGQLLYFHPHYGWGWSRMEEDAPPLSYEERSGPSPFHLRVHRFYRHNEVLRGAVTVVEEAGHKYNGLWAVFYTRGDMSDLTENLPVVDILIGPDEPVQAEWEEPEMSRMWPRWNFSQSPQIVGYGMVAETPEHLQRKASYS